MCDNQSIVLCLASQCRQLHFGHPLDHPHDRVTKCLLLSFPIVFLSICFARTILVHTYCFVIAVFYFLPPVFVDVNFSQANVTLVNFRIYNLCVRMI